MQDYPIPITSSWWRFTEYEVRDSPEASRVGSGMRDYFRYIRPTPGARLERFEVGIGPDAAGNINVDLDEILSLELESEEPILKWCCRHGLLGVLPEQAWLIRLAPRWGVPFGDMHTPILVPSQKIYVRTHTGWRETVRSRLGQGENSLTLEEGESVQDILDKIVIPEDTNLPRPSMLSVKLFSDEIEEQDLDKGLGTFFPDVPSNDLLEYRYPIPLSGPFWHQYAESVATFRDRVERFRAILERLRGIGPLDELPDEALWNLVRGQTELNALLSVNPALGLGHDAFEPKWAFSSLLAMFAFAAWMKLVGGSSVRQCQRPRCRRLFITSVKTKRYCSERCRRNEETARVRRKKKR